MIEEILLALLLVNGVSFGYSLIKDICETWLK